MYHAGEGAPAPAEGGGFPVVLVSPYELGRQPFGVAEAAAWLRDAGFPVRCIDLSRDRLDPEALRDAGLVAVHLAMHTAGRIAAAAFSRLRELAPRARFAVFGLYAPVNEAYFRELGAGAVLGGEVEPALVAYARECRDGSGGLQYPVPAGARTEQSGRGGRSETKAARPPDDSRTRVAASDRSGGENGSPATTTVAIRPKRGSEPRSGCTESSQSRHRAGHREGGASHEDDGIGPASGPNRREAGRGTIHLEKIAFLVPDRSGLPPLDRYARLELPGGGERVVGFAEASRGCKHLCRHCPIVPVYDGRFRVVPRDVVLADIRQQAAAGAEHISFGDPDFFNGPTHALRIVEGMHAEHPHLTFDATIKIEHLLRHRSVLPRLRDAGCLFITSAVEAVDDEILARLRKNHTAADFEEATALMRSARIALAPTFVAFTPWTTLAGYRDLLERIAALRLVASVPPVQLSIRLLIPDGSRLLELPEIRDLVDPFDRSMLGYPWRHPDPRVDELQARIGALVESGSGGSREETFAAAWRLVHAALGAPAPPLPRALGEPIPHHSEPWYCCAEPTGEQLAGF